MLALDDYLKKRVKMAMHAKGDPQIARQALNCLDLTTLKGDETKDDIQSLCTIAKANHVASVCIYPSGVLFAKAAIKESNVNIATVINFPTGSKRTQSNDDATVETTAHDVACAIAAGATQIDIVLPYAEFQKGNTQYCADLLETCRQGCDKGVTMKVILETASFEDAKALRHACQLAIECGTDCLKTSTGMHEKGGATLESAALLLDEARHADREIGVKISGGVKTVDDCARYISLATMLKGQATIRPETFRIGASSVLNELLETCKYENFKQASSSPSSRNLDY